VCLTSGPLTEVVVARRWVLTDNTFWHARWNLIDYFIDYIGYIINYIDYFLRLHQLQPTASSSSATSTSVVKMPNENPITYEELSDEHKQKYNEIKAAFEADLIGSFERTRHHGINGRDSHLKVHSTKWICLLLRKNARELSARKSTTWWLIRYIDILRVW
jgi:hypothetical protein